MFDSFPLIELNILHGLFYYPFTTFIKIAPKKILINILFLISSRKKFYIEHEIEAAPYSIKKSLDSFEFDVHKTKHHISVI